MAWAKITYRDFYDVPRIFVVHRRGDCLLFDCEFDQEADEYPPTYNVYLLPDMPAAELTGDWTLLRNKATRLFGQVEVRRVQFDPTLRESVNLDILDSAWHT